MTEMLCPKRGTPTKAWSKQLSPYEIVGEKETTGGTKVYKATIIAVKDTFKKV